MVFCSFSDCASSPSWHWSTEGEEEAKEKGDNDEEWRDEGRSMFQFLDNSLSIRNNSSQL